MSQLSFLLDNDNDDTYHTGLLWEWNKLIYVRNSVKYWQYYLQEWNAKSIQIRCENKTGCITSRTDGSTGPWHLPCIGPSYVKVWRYFDLFASLLGIRTCSSFPSGKHYSFYWKQFCGFILRQMHDKSFSVEGCL